MFRFAWEAVWPERNAQLFRVLAKIIFVLLKDPCEFLMCTVPSFSRCVELFMYHRHLLLLFFGGDSAGSVGSVGGVGGVGVGSVEQLVLLRTRFFEHTLKNLRRWK